MGTDGGVQLPRRGKVVVRSRAPTLTMARGGDAVPCHAMPLRSGVPDVHRWGRRKPLRRACSVCSVKNILSSRRSFFRKNHFQTLHTLQGRESSLCGHLETVCPFHEYTLRCAVCPAAGMPYSWIQRPCPVCPAALDAWRRDRRPPEAAGRHSVDSEWPPFILTGAEAAQNGCKCETGGQSPPVSVSPIHSRT